MNNNNNNNNNTTIHTSYNSQILHRLAGFNKKLYCRMIILNILYQHYDPSLNIFHTGNEK